MNPVYFALLARRRMDLHGATSEDFAQVKVKNSRHGLQNPNARYRKESTIEDVLASRSCPIPSGNSTSAPPATGRPRSSSLARSSPKRISAHWKVFRRCAQSAQ